MIIGATYCGAPPVPGTLLGRFNVDPVLIIILLMVAALHWRAVHRSGGTTAFLLMGWAIALFAFTSPLCALSVSLFSARVGQHMILILLAAPLIASAPVGSGLSGLHSSRSVWASSTAFFLALWFWHMPTPYAATFSSTLTYWAMHLSLFGSAIWLWSALIWQSRDNAAAALIAGTVSSIHMGLLGAVIALAARPMYAPHIYTTIEWGLSPLADQQLGGVLMWVPGCLFFLWIASRSFWLLFNRVEGART